MALCTASNCLLPGLSSSAWQSSSDACHSLFPLTYEGLQQCWLLLADWTSEQVTATGGNFCMHAKSCHFHDMACKL